MAGLKGPPPSSPGRDLSAIPNLPELADRDPEPFKEQPEPRPPRGGSPEEKIDYLRAVLKLKEDMITRGRTAYALVFGDVAHLRETAEQLRNLLVQERARAEAATTRLTQLETELREVHAERSDLSKALAEVEAQVPQLQEELRHERSSRGEVAEELISLKEAVSVSERQITELQATNSKLEADLEGINEQYESSSAESERISTELSEAQASLSEVRETLGNLRRERDDLQHELDAATAQLSEKQTLFDEANQQLGDAQAEAEQLVSSVADLQKKAETLEQALNEERERAGEARDRSGSELAEAEGKIEALEAALTEEQERARNLQVAIDELEVQLHSASSDKDQQKAATDAQLRKLRDELTAAHNKKLAEVQGQVSQLQSRAQEAAAAWEEERSTERSRIASGGKAELAAAQKKAADAVAALQKERAAREAAEKKASDSDAKFTEAIRLAAVAENRARSGGGAPDDVIRERDRLREDLASLKRKLVAAETAIEMVASLKSKVAKLEAQLKTKK